MTFYNKTKEEVLKHFNIDEKSGLSAKSVAEAMEEFGPNRLSEKKSKSMLSRFFDQFRDVMIVILLLAAAVSFGWKRS